jgi:hypothetical protein
MKRTLRIVFPILSVLVITAAVVPIASAQGTGALAGVYENFTIGKPSGDLEGMRVVIIPAGGGYHAMVQIAQGGAEDPKPEFVPVTVNGATVEFNLGDRKYTGTVGVAGLRIKDPDGKTAMLKRRPCATLFR